LFFPAQPINFPFVKMEIADVGFERHQFFHGCIVERFG
jgi:hypothetical protein